MNTIVTLFLALAPFSPSLDSTTAAVGRMADARAEQLADVKVAESDARMSAARAERVAHPYRHASATVHAPTLARATATEPAGG